MSGLVTLTLAMGLLSIFGIGLLLLLVGAGLASVLVRRLPGAGPWAVASGVAMAVGLATATIVAVQPPVVTFTTGGISSSSSLWSGGSTLGHLRHHWPQW